MASGLNKFAQVGTDPCIKWDKSHRHQVEIPDECLDTSILLDDSDPK
jgi:hypothetical protein